MSIETFLYVLQNDAATRAIVSATNPLLGADLLNRSVPRRIVGWWDADASIQNQARHFVHLSIFGWSVKLKGSDRRKSFQSKRITLLGSLLMFAMFRNNING